MLVLWSAVRLAVLVMVFAAVIMHVLGNVVLVSPMIVLVSLGDSESAKLVLRALTTMLVLLGQKLG